jgi:hypothetical protein
LICEQAAPCSIDAACRYQALRELPRHLFFFRFSCCYPWSMPNVFQPHAIIKALGYAALLYNVCDFFQPASIN